METATDPTPDHWFLLESGKLCDETTAIAALLQRCPLSPQERQAIGAETTQWVSALRAGGRRSGGAVEDFLQEFSLSTREGIALMGLAEALLRTPDDNTRNILIAEKIGAADWSSHRGRSDRLTVNAAAWALTWTDRLIGAGAREPDTGNPLRRLAERIGEPLVRRAVVQAVRLLGDQFVLGRTIEKALRRADREGIVCSFDMLGEGARTHADALRYEQLYADAIAAVGESSRRGGPEQGHGISVKLSALLPRYKGTQRQRAWSELYPRLKRLALIAAQYNLNLTIDAEEADVMILSLQLFERLAREHDLGPWRGLGLVVQAYQKNAPRIIAWLSALARASGRRFMVRLVKGAYWDTEIKRAQVAGLPGYPVFTTKAATDLSYLVCAQALIEAAPDLYPQFATHNAHTLVAVRRLAARAGAPLEHQRLHGMGEALYETARERCGDLALRVYTPVGGHEELLAYLVRRLLENGANSSFVHALSDPRIPVQEIVRDPVAQVEANPGPHPGIPLPRDLYGGERRNSTGRDLSQDSQCRPIADALQSLRARPVVSGPIIAGELRSNDNAATRSPSDPALVTGAVSAATPSDIDRAFELAKAAQPDWDRAGGAARAAVLDAMADALEQQLDRLVALLALEAGKTLEDGVAEVREAADYCRYYAVLARRQFAQPLPLPGPSGESNTLELRGRGVFVCISPWNFPLAIFTGQIAAALAAGNAVLAKPAEQTPLIAAQVVSLLHRSGLDPRLLALLPGPGDTIGAALVGDPRLDGVAFTGGTDTARRINRTLALRDGPIVPFIAETGGLNGLFVDTTALREQVIDDVMASAFGAAGQRCSALRVLFLPQERADELIAGLIGALEVMPIGDPADPAVDMGPIIDEEARAHLIEHIAQLEAEGRILYRRDVGELARRGCFLGPVIAEIPTPDFLRREIFGPILHIHRYRTEDAQAVARLFAAAGYGLTLGVHSRIDAFAERIRGAVPAGNTYVNRSIIGAVVGVQPFGGEGLSGTGPKAGGPYSLLRYATERTLTINRSAQGGDPNLLNLAP